MKITRQRIEDFIIPKLKFAGTSGFSTLLDYVIVFLLLEVFDYRAEATVFGIKLVLANTIGTAAGMISNFLLQKKYVFKSNRALWIIILMTFGFSFFGFFLNQFLFDMIRRVSAFMSQHTFATKVLVTGIMFFFNFYTKRFSFERSKKSKKKLGI